MTMPMGFVWLVGLCALLGLGWALIQALFFGRRNQEEFLG